MAAMVAGTFVLGSCQADGPEEDIPFVKEKTHSSEITVEIGGIKGFENVLATRACDKNSNMWGNLDELLPYPTQAEKEGILKYVQENPGAAVSWPGYKYYYVQDVTGAHHTYTYKDYNGADHSMDGTSSMEELCIREDINLMEEWEKLGIQQGWNSEWTHTNDFNCGKNGNNASHGSVLMTAGFVEARTLDEYGSSSINQWRLYYWQGNYYLCFDFSTHKDDGGVDPDGIYDDWIVKIIPGKGETPKSPDVDPTDDPDDDPSVDPDPEPKRGEVEVDIHHQDHKDWNEIKTSIHLRDTVNVRVFIPADYKLQAKADDFDIRTGVDYTYVVQEFTEVIPVKYTIASREYEVNAVVNHTAAGIEILIEGSKCAEALRAARGIYDDGITFEIHTYLKPEATKEQIWDILKNVQMPATSLNRWPNDGNCITHTHWKIHSAYYEDQFLEYTKDPEK